MNKTILKSVAVIAVLLGSVYATQAQEKLQLKLGYNISTPVGKFADEIDKTSFRGFTGELAYPLSSKLQVGLGVMYNDYYQKYPRQVYAVDHGSISAVITNSIQTVPILAKVNYNIVQRGFVKPYISVGAGGDLITYKQYLGEFPYSKTAFKPAVNGDAGVNIAMGKTKTAGINLGANFNYLPFNYNGISNLNSWGAHAGIFFALR